MGPVWGIHFIAYVPLTLKLTLLAAGGLLLVPGVQRSLFVRITHLTAPLKVEKKVRILPVVIIAAVCFMIFRSLTIATDIYGDDILMLKDYHNNSIFDWNWIGDVFSPKLVVNKEALTVAVHRIVAHLFSISIASSYKIMSEFCGALFIGIWVWFVQKITVDNNKSTWPLRIVLIVLGMFAGGIQVFFGHVENYSFGILTFTFFLVALYFFIEEKIGTLAFVLIYLLAFKAHIIGVLFSPAFLVAILYRYRHKLPKVPSLFHWRAMLWTVILPAFMLGVVLYIFLFHSWDEPYAYTTGRQFQQSFLPIVGLPPPLDHYSLLSPNHIADLFNLILIVAAPIILMLVSIMVFNRKELSWSQPNVMIFGLAALFPFLFFLAMNPMLSPMRDWDVYTLLFPPLLFFLFMLLTQSQLRVYGHVWLAHTLVFGVLFTSVLIAVNASPDELQLRLQDAGVYTYHTYYAGSDYIEARSFEIADTSKYAHAHFATLVTGLALEPFAGNNPELAVMMSRLASYYASINDGDSALVWAEAACKTDSRIHRYFLDLAGYYVQMDRLEEGSKVLTQFLKNREERDDTDNSYLDQIAATMAQLGARYSRQGKDSLTIVWAEAARKMEPRTLSYTTDLAAYYIQTERPRQALSLLRTISPDSASIDILSMSGLAAADVLGPDSGLPYLYRAKEMAPHNATIDSMILTLKRSPR